MTVKAILATKGTDVLSIEPTATLETAVKMLAQHRIGALLVFGPDVRLTNRVRFWAAARKVRRGANCLVWIAPDG